jgi:hypothetical protein
VALPDRANPSVAELVIAKQVPLAELHVPESGSVMASALLARQILSRRPTEAIAVCFELMVISFLFFVIVDRSFANRRGRRNRGT